MRVSEAIPARWDCPSHVRDRQITCISVIGLGDKYGRADRSKAFGNDYAQRLLRAMRSGDRLGWHRSPSATPKVQLETANAVVTISSYPDSEVFGLQVFAASGRVIGSSAQASGPVAELGRLAFAEAGVQTAEQRRQSRLDRETAREAAARNAAFADIAGL